jgi:hypothetical protein
MIQGDRGAAPLKFPAHPEPGIIRIDKAADFAAGCFNTFSFCKATTFIGKQFNDFDLMWFSYFDKCQNCYQWNHHRTRIISQFL